MKIISDVLSVTTRKAGGQTFKWTEVVARNETSKRAKKTEEYWWRTVHHVAGSDIRSGPGERPGTFEPGELDFFKANYVGYCKLACKDYQSHWATYSFPSVDQKQDLYHSRMAGAHVSLSHPLDTHLLQLIGDLLAYESSLWCQSYSAGRLASLPGKV
jgi:hypothetical protein